jgi:hypothetical protein
MSESYPVAFEGEDIRVDWKNGELHLACCDCNLVHIFRFKVVGNILTIRAWRHNRKTAALRRYRGVPIKDKNAGAKTAG